MSYPRIIESIQKAAEQLTQELGGAAESINNSTEKGPFDGENVLSDKAWGLAQSIITNCNQMISILTPQRYQALKFACSAALPYAVGIVAHFRIADLIEEKGGTASVADLAKSAGTDEAKLANVLRTLSCYHTFTQETPGVYRNNRQSRMFLREEKAVDMIEFYSVTLGSSFTGLLPLMIDPIDMHSIDARKSAFSKAHGNSMSIVDWMSLPSNQTQLSQFLSGLPWLSKISAEQVVNSYTWYQWGTNFHVCDMGCADGMIMSYLKNKHPSVKITCQDLESSLPMAKKVMEDNHPESVEKGEIIIQEHDYFTPQETSADVYWMRGVLHDYNDEDCITILKHLIPRLQENSHARVVINEIVQPSIIIDPSNPHEPASGGLQYEQSAFPEVTALMQLHTTAFMGGMERAYEEFEALFKRAGFEIANFKKLQHFTCIMELRLSA
ncbi:Nn.00g017580.m01.CDS01 [Neocucurbitaria sp. VM-36]